jgi:hypothetical protein
MAFSVDARFIDLAEAKLLVRFPVAHRQALLRRNGGEIELRPGDFWELFPVKDDSDTVRLKRTWDDVVRRTELARSWARFPANAVAIGHDGCGNLLVVLPDGSAEPRVAVWDHETGDLEFVDGDILTARRQV